jgi:hypothetical protein
MKEIYVSSNGSGDGSESSPCNLEKAKRLVRNFNQDMSSDINVYIDGGTYFLSTPFVLSHEDSGSNGFKIRWRNKPGAKPIFSGAQIITDWSLHDTERKIWKASIPKGLYFKHLWINGKRLRRAWSGWNPKGFKNTKKGVKLADPNIDISKWKNIKEILVFKKFIWRYIPCRVQKIESRELLLNPKCIRTYRVPRSALGVLNQDVLYWMNSLVISNADIALENVYEFLTDEGEWYLDCSESIVYYKPFESDGFNAKSEITYSNLKTFILLDGTVQYPISNLEIKGITFEYNTGTKMGITAGSPTEPTLAIPPKPENALQINAGLSIIVNSNIFMHIGSDAIHFDLKGNNIKIVGNGFCDISRAAISLNQTNTIVSEANKSEVLPENADKFFDGIEISNNYIRYTGIDDIGAAIVYSEFSQNVKVFHNEIREVPTLAVRNGWRFLAWKKHTANIEYAWNKVSDVGQANMGDYGGLYISCCNVGKSSIHHNYINGAGLSDRNNGIYLDVYASNVKIYNNVCNNMPQKSELGIGGWLGLIISENNEIYKNWTDSNIIVDASIPDNRTEPSPTNKLYDNYYHSKESEDWPIEAQAVMKNAGLIPKYKFIQQIIDSELNKGYFPLVKLYTYSKKQE